MPAYIDGRVPVSVSTLEASIGIQTPYIQQASGASLLGVPNPAGPDNFVVLSGVQTLSSKTLLNPVITSGALTQPVVTSGVFTAPTINTALMNTPDIRMTGGGTMTGGIMHNVIGGVRVVATIATGATKTLDLSTADVFVIDLTQNCTLTITNGQSGKLFQVITKQTSSNFFTMSWMTGYVSEEIASQPTNRSSAMDVFNVLFDGTNHFGWGIKDVQG